MAESIMAKDNDPAEKRYPSEMHRKQRNKNLAVFFLLAGFVVLIYFVAIVRMSGGD